MKYLVLWLSACLLSYASFAQQKERPLEIKHLQGDFYIYTTYSDYQGTLVPSNSMYVLTTQGIVMLDVPWDTTKTTVLIDKIERQHHKKVIACFSTHFHNDRTAGLDILTARGIKTYGTAMTRALCIEKKEQVPQNIIPEDTIFHFGNHKMRIFYPGKGHAPDNIVIWFPDEKILYGGCFIKSTEAKDLGNLSDADPEAWRVSAKKVAATFPDRKIVIPGHNGWKNPRSLEHTQKLVESYLKAHKD